MDAAAAALLRGRRLLLVQDARSLDQSLIRGLSTAGVEVAGPAHDVEEVNVLMNRGLRISGAIIDVELDVVQAIGVADVLLARGIPFLFAIGEDHVADMRRYPGFIFCRKPIFLNEIAVALFGSDPPAGSA
jgi:hypothetical protein